MSSLLQVEHLNVSFATQTGEVAAVRDVSFAIPESGTLGLVGESGSGKSATSLAIMRLLPPQARTTGKISFAGADLLALPDADMRDVRGARISMIFQEPMTALNPVMRVGDQVAEAVLAHHRVSKAEAWTRTVEPAGLRNGTTSRGTGWVRMSLSGLICHQRLAAPTVAASTGSCRPRRSRGSRV